MGLQDGEAYEKQYPDQEQKTDIKKIPLRVRYYLLDFKDQHYNTFYDWYKKEALRDLTLTELNDMLEKVSHYDMIEISNIK